MHSSRERKGAVQAQQKFSNLPGARADILAHLPVYSGAHCVQPAEDPYVLGLEEVPPQLTPDNAFSGLRSESRCRL
jgi:hypothetical protein